MLIGLTYDLRDDYLAQGYSEIATAEFDRGDTIDALEETLGTLGHDTERIGNLRQLVTALGAGRRWDLVFNIAEGLAGMGREAQVPALLDAYEIPYTFADPLGASLTLHKGMAKSVLRDRGIRSTGYRIVAGEADLARVDLRYPLFVKPVAEGTAKGIIETSRVETPEELARECRRVIADFDQPALVEPFLEGREFTVGITGTGSEAVAVGTMEVILLTAADRHAYTYENKEHWEERCRYALATPEWASEAEALSLAAWRALHGRDGGRVDLRADRTGRLFVMELNPLPGLHPSHSDLPILANLVGVPYVELIGRIVESATRRVASATAR